jgi:oligoribonuclease NrnB/cAMP/cGMP phosphodiesterase (DHH superfamily)
MIKVIYHANCADGFCAAYLLWKKFGGQGEYIPMHYGTELDLSKFNKEDDIYIVDFSFRNQVIWDLAENVNSITLLDHHKTAQAELEGSEWPYNVYVDFDMTRCGAMMVWETYHQQDPGIALPPKLVQYVQDRDLWKWELEYSKEVSMYLRSIPFDFEEWRKIEDYIEDPIEFNLIVSQGAAILRYQKIEIDQAVKHAKRYKLKVEVEANPEHRFTKEYNFLAVNTTVNFSEVAGELAELDSKYGVGIGWFHRSDGKYQYSLRSRNEGLDVSEIAKAFGGGGHRNAAGFESSYLLLVPTIEPIDLIGKTIKVPKRISQSGFITVFGHDPCGGNTLQPSVTNSNPNYIVYESDEEGVKIKQLDFFISDNEMEGILNEQ